MKRLVLAVLVCALIASAFALAGCGKPSLQGEWVKFAQDDNSAAPSGSLVTVTVDKDWVTVTYAYADGSYTDGQPTDVPPQQRYRYTVTGDTALQLDNNGQTTDVQYALNGDSLTLSNLKDPVNGTYARAGSSAAQAIKQQWAKLQTDAKTAGNKAVAQQNKQQSQQDCWDAQQQLQGAFSLYFSNLMNGSLGNYKYQNKSDAIISLMHSEFQVGMTSDQVVAELLKVGKDAGSAAPLNDDGAKTTIKCPSDGTITLTGWQDNKYVPTFKCSIHGSPAQ